MSKKASQATLSALHLALAASFLDILEKGELVQEKDSGEWTRVKPGASMFNAIRQFLKDNDITALEDSSPEMKGLVDRTRLPFQSAQDEYGPVN